MLATLRYDIVQERKRILADHREMIHSAMRVDPWRSVLEILLTITASVLLVWSGVFAVETGQWWLLPVIFVFISALQHRLSILQHEAVHTLLFTQKGLNDLVGLYVIGPSIGVLSSFSRRAHLSHP